MRPVLIDATLWIPIYDFPSNCPNMTELQETELPEIGNIEVEKSSKHSSKPVAGTSNHSRMSDEASTATSYSGSNSEGSESAHPLCGGRTRLNLEHVGLRKQSILSRLKRALHLRNDLPPGFTYDYKLEQIVRSCKSSSSRPNCIH